MPTVFGLPLWLKEHLQTYRLAYDTADDFGMGNDCAIEKQPACYHRPEKLSIMATS